MSGPGDNCILGRSKRVTEKSCCVTLNTKMGLGYNQRGEEKKGSGLCDEGSVQERDGRGEWAGAGEEGSGQGLEEEGSEQGLGKRVVGRN